MVLVDTDIMDLITRINELLGRLEGMKFEQKIEKIANPTMLSTLREVESIIFRITSILRRLGLPENVKQAIDLLQRGAAAARAFQLAVTTAMAATGPFGIAIAGLGAVSAAIIGADTLGSMVDTQ